MNKNDSILMLCGSDALGRRIEPVGAFNDKQVGMFYFLWIGQHGSAKFDNSVLALDVQKNDRSGEDVHHYWAKPLYGYYDSGDRWVFRKHLQMLTMAGVDYLVFDTTNSYYYQEVCHNIFPVALEMIEEGWNIPRFVFDTNCRSSETVKGIYEAYYNPATENGKRYAPLWYRHPDRNNRNFGHKPWIIAKNNETGDNQKYNYSALPEDIRNFFYLRESAWFVEDKVPYAFATDVDNPTLHEGMISVSVAQHTSGAFSDSVFEEGRRDDNRGRGYSRKDGKNDETRIARGSCFEEEWQRAFSNKDTDNVFLSTWNEWVAQKQQYKLNGRSSCYFVDQYNTEFSRDIEPADNELADNYYMQTVKNIRAFKCKSAAVAAERAHTVDIHGGAKAWRQAKYYAAFTGDGEGRKHKSSNYGLPEYVQSGAVNDISGIRVACDEKYVYFEIECEGKLLSDKKSGEYPSVWISDGNGGYSHRISVKKDGNAQIHRIENGTDRTAGGAECVIGKNSLSVKAERAAMNLAGKEKGFAFKVTDGIESLDNVLECYSVGKSVPLGRLDYFFLYKE